ncbi:MAG TPA: hypothetical protein VJV78_18675 [Polyangiales bacterium]|nr:hypothetical protein [Polyangiales bacterium]
MADVTQLATASNSVCALHSGGRIACWGNNIHGELGSGSTQPSTSSIPLAVVGIQNARAIQFSPGAPAGTNATVHACAITEDSKLLCWGSNDSGELGNGQRAKGVATEREQAD